MKNGDSLQLEKTRCWYIRERVSQCDEYFPIPAYVEGAEASRRIFCPDERQHLASLAVYLFGVVQEVSHEARVVIVRYFVGMQHEAVPRTKEARLVVCPVYGLKI